MRTEINFTRTVKSTHCDCLLVSKDGGTAKDEIVILGRELDAKAASKWIDKHPALIPEGFAACVVFNATVSEDLYAWSLDDILPFGKIVPGGRNGSKETDTEEEA